jgi:hypothetical protein
MPTSAREDQLAIVLWFCDAMASFSAARAEAAAFRPSGAGTPALASSGVAVGLTGGVPVPSLNVFDMFLFLYFQRVHFAPPSEVLVTRRAAIQAATSAARYRTRIPIVE